MDEKISLEEINRYGNAYADKVLDVFFASKESITGPEVLTLCNLQQINLFVIRELFKSWKEETRKLRSPYFNYDLPEIREALDNLMTLLSQHISISRPNFEPLLKKAISQTLLVVFDPYDFYSMIITKPNNKLEVASFREEIKYIKVNKAPLERMVQKLEEKGLKEISGNEAFSTLDQILEEVNFTPEDVEGYMAQFSAIVPLDANKFFVAKTETEVVQPTPVALPVVEKRQDASAPPKRSEQVYANKPAVRVTLNESLNRQGRSTLADNFHRVGKIRDSLTINQKFMFTKVLFHGDFELFSQAIEHLDKLDNKKAAMRYLENEHAGAWDHDSDEYHEFMELVDKRFGS